MSRRSSRKSAILRSYVEEVPESPKAHQNKAKIQDDIANPATKSTKKQVVKVEAEEEVVNNNLPRQSISPKKPSTKVKEEVTSSTIKKTPTKRKALSDVEDEGPPEPAKKLKKPRKTKEQKEEDMLPLAARTSVNGLKKAVYIGAHVSAAGGVDKSIGNAVHIGGNAFALFLKSQRKWVSPPLSAEARDAFKTMCLDLEKSAGGFDAAKHILPHGSYLVNLAALDKEKAEQAYDCFLDDLTRCEELGIRLYNFHPGNTNGNPREDAIGRIAAQLNRAHKATKTVVTLLENMAGQGNTIGSKFEDLRDVIALIEDKERVGVCIDTCHSFAAGYDLRSPESFKETMDAFDSIVGIKYLKAVHLNDSKAPFESHRDLHANIGTGFLGLRAFHNLVNSPLFANMPMVLETPIDKKGEDGKTIEDRRVWATEIKLLESLIDMDVESEAFKTEEARLWEAGTGERERLQGQADRKKEKGQKTLDSMFKKGKGKKKTKAADSGDESEGGCSH